MADVNSLTDAVKKALRPLEECLQALNLVFPKKLFNLLTKAKDLLGKEDASDKDLRSFIYREMFYFLSRENEVGEGLSLIYPPEVVQAIRELYPADVCNYKPRSRKRQNLYEVPLKEFIEVYREADLRNGEGLSKTSKSSKI
ncbi:uncharacterized protein LOC144648707 [Oculina patagonica]